MWLWSLLQLIAALGKRSKDRPVLQEHVTRSGAIYAGAVAGFAGIMIGLCLSACSVLELITSKLGPDSNSQLEPIIFLWFLGYSIVGITAGALTGFIISQRNDNPEINTSRATVNLVAMLIGFIIGIIPNIVLAWQLYFIY